MTCRQTLTGMLVIALVVLASGCDRAPVGRTAPGAAPARDIALRERDTSLLREVDALNERCASRWWGDPECLERACRLRTRELDLFDDVRAHTFSDIGESDYWHRGRLKFPGDLEQLLRRLSEESPRRGAAPCQAFGAVGDPPPQR